MSDSIKSLQSLALLFREERNWKQFHHLKDMLLSLQIETSELLELFQWKSDEEAKAIEKEQIGDELSDILYWLLLLASDLEIDLPTAFHHKMDKNQEKYPIDKSYNSSKKYTDL